MMLHRFTNGRSAAQAVSSLSWVKTTWGQYETAVGGGGDTNSGDPAYVVVAHGNFTSEPGGEAPLAATVVVMTFDGATQKLSTIDCLHNSDGIKESTLGQMSAMALPDTTE